MRYFLSVFLLAFTLINVNAAVPVITYTPPPVYTVGTAITTLSPNSSGGGAVPATIFSTVSTFVPSSSAIQNPRGLSTDGAGNVYEADFNGNKIYKITSTGVVSVIAGSGTAAESNNTTGSLAQFNGPSGVVYDASGYLYVTDYTGNTVRRITLTAPYAVITIAGTGTAAELDNATGTSAKFNAPAGIDYDGSANIYVADYAGNKIRKISKTAPYAVTTIAGNGTAAEVNNTTGTSAQFKAPAGIVYTSANLFVCDFSGNTVRQISLTAPYAVTTLAGSGTAGSTNATGTAATFKTPYGVAVDASGNLYVADEGNNLIRMISSGGVVTTLAGSGAQNDLDGVGTAAQFYSPYCIEADNAGNLFVGDNNTTNSTCRKILLTGYTISPTLPAGLAFDGTTGNITGNPTTVSAATTYTVTAYNASGSVSTTVSIAVNPSAPTATPGTGCGAGSVTLSASGGSPSGGSYNWYSALTGGSVLATGSTYSPSITTTTTFYVTYMSGGIESSPRTAVTATVYSTPVISTAPTSPTASLYLSYPFTGNANDVSGNSNNGTVQASAPLTTDRYGAANSAYSFDGATQYISTATPSNSPGPQNFSISVWFKTSTAGGLLVGYGATQTGASSMYDRHIYMSNSGQLYFGLYPSAVKTINTTATYADGSWHHAVATVSTTTGSSLYVDGALQAVDATMTTSQNYGTTGYWRVAYNSISGWTNQPSNFYFTGSLDDIAVYNTTLTAAQVYTLYGAGSSPVCAGSTLSLQANTVTGATGYSWSGPGGYTSTSQNPTVTTNATTANAGTYTLTVTGAHSCTSTIAVTAVVNALPSAVFTAPTAVDAGTNATITYTGTDPVTSTYVWDFNGGSPATGSGQGPFSVQWSTSGIKTITLTVTNAGGCSTVYTQTVTVNGTTYSTYANRMLLTLKTTSLGISNDLTNFPFLVTITDPSLIVTTGGCSNNVQFPNGPNYDFAFVDAVAGEIPYQVESYNSTTGVLLVWVKIPTLTHLVNNTISFYYGAPTAPATHTTAFYQSTWASDYLAVYHFNETTYTGTTADGTSNAHTGTTSGMTSASLVSGKIGNAYTFNGSNTKVASSNNADITGNFTLSAWINMSVASKDQKIITNEGSAGGYKLGVYNNNIAEVETRNASGSPVTSRSANSGTALAANTWYYVQGVFNGTNLTMFVNGVQDCTYATAQSPAVGSVVNIGVEASGASGFNFNGIIDEPRISNVAKSSDWIKAEYANQNSPATFINAGSYTTNYANAVNINGGVVYSTANGVSYTYTLNSVTSSGTPANNGTASVIVTGNVTLPSTASVYALTVNSSDKIDLNGLTVNVGCNIVNNGTITNSSGTAGSIVFNGSAATQTYTGSALSAGTIDNLTVNNSAAGTVTITGGAVSVTNLLTLTSGSLFIDNTNSGALTLTSTATKSASVAAIPSASSITGTVNVQRYISGGNNTFRGYRLMSSPVYNGADSHSNNIYSINYVQTSALVTGTSASGGFDKVGNPSIYLFRQDQAPNNQTFTTGNFWGISKINNSPNYNYYFNGGSTAYNIPVGNGFMFFFRGDRTTNLAAKYTSTTSAEAVTMSTSGTLNQGPVTVKDWYTPTLGGLDYTSTTGNTNSAVLGYNLVGNPYASSINWDTYSTTVATAGIYAPGINNYIYVYNSTSKNYGVYVANATGGTGTNGTTKTIPSGQGFFVRSFNASNVMTFNEAAKVSTQVTGTNLLLGTPIANKIDKFLRLKFIKDTINTDDIILNFDQNSTASYNVVEDAATYPGNGVLSLSSLSTDNVPLAYNTLPLPKQSQIVNLKINATSSGVYQLMMTEIQAIPQLYDIWLMDAYKKDSLDMRHNTTYAFDVDVNDTTTYLSKRFSLVIRQNPALALHLINFNAAKATSGAQIIWKTENEQNYTNFTVERSTDNGKTFDVLGGFVSSASGTYSFLDKNPVQTTTDRYRLKLEDLDGTITYSNVVPLQYTNLSDNGTSNALTVYPNPTSGMVNLSIDQNAAIASDLSALQSLSSAPGLIGGKTASSNVYEIKIISINGAVIKTVTSSQPNWQGNFTGLVPGTYIIQVINNKDNSLVGKSTFVKL